MNNTELINDCIKGTIERAVYESLACLVIILCNAYSLQRGAVGTSRFYGCLFSIVACVFIVGVVWSFALSRRLLNVHPPTDHVFWRKTFLNQARFIRLAPAWNFAPVGAGFLLFCAPTSRGQIFVFIGPVIVLTAAFTYTIWISRNAAAAIEEAAETLTD